MLDFIIMKGLSMARPEKVEAVEETEVENKEVEAKEAPKKEKPAKKAKEVAEEAPVEAEDTEVEDDEADDDVEGDEDEEEVYDREWHEARAAEVKEAFENGNKMKALAKILEINTGLKYTKGEAENILDAVQQYIILCSYTQGVTRLPYLGKIDLVDVPEKKGKIKTQGAEKEWVSPAHSTLKFKANDYLKEMVSFDGEDYEAKVLNQLLVEDQLGEEEEATEEEAAE